MRKTLKKAEILRGRIKFQQVFSSGRKVAGRIIQCIVAVHPGTDQTDTPHAVIGVTINRRVRRAVDRNRIKRLIREAYRLNKEGLVQKLQESSQHVEMIFHYSPPRSVPLKLPQFANVNDDMQSILRSVSEKMV